MRASIKRSQTLVENVMDFARAKLGGGITLRIEPDRDLVVTIRDVVEEMRASHPDRQIEVSFHVDRKVPVDQIRIGQMLSNLLGTAITHGAEDVPIRVEAGTSATAFELTVINGGEPIPVGAVDRLFQPFHRDDENSTRGLGLGLYIASRIAEAHGVRIDVRSNTQETAFTFTMPVG